MKFLFVLSILVVFFAGCNDGNKSPDISGIKYELPIQRFDEAIFTMDTNAIPAALVRLQSQFPTLLPVYLQNIVGVTDETGIKTFLRLYRPVYDSAQELYKNFEPVKEKIETGLRYTKYYFPNYQLPKNIIPVLGPMNAREDLAQMANGDLTPNFLGPDFIGVSLQFYLGKNFSLYQQPYFVNAVAPVFRSRRFDKAYIPADVLKLIVDDMYPDKSKTKPLIEQMVEKGKQWWLLDRLLPGEPDSVKTGYTQIQLDWCQANEGNIWSYFLKNENIYALDPPTIQNYLGESPFTQGFSQEYSPGNIGQWLGWQIVKKYKSDHPEASEDAIMKLPAKTLLDEAKYKPR